MKQTTQAIRIILLLLAACLSLAAGCSVKNVNTGRVWRDSARGNVSPGKTLVLSLATDATVSILIENEWARQLRSRGIEADAANKFLPADRPTDESDIIALVKEQGFDTLLVSQPLKAKKVSRDASHSQVAVIETKLYDTGTGKMFWKAQSDIFLVSGDGGQVQEPQGDKLRRFVETVIQKMSESQVL